ncbi:hypothetical protein [Streptomyces sp. NPDC058108]
MPVKLLPARDGGAVPSYAEPVAAARALAGITATRSVGDGDRPG